MNRKERKIELKKSIKQYAEELANLTDKAKFSDKLKEYFDFIGKFYKYSWHNRILIHSQYPNASLIAGFHTWKKQFGRSVKASSKAIWIFAPRIYKTIEEVKYKNPDTGEWGEFKEEEQEHIYFVPVPVFDVNQTEGKPIPNIDYGTNTSNHKELLIKFEGMLSKENIKLEYKPMGEIDFGYNQKGIIILNSKKSTDDNLKTGFHEYAHNCLHWDKDRGKYNKKQKETEAEATAFIVCRFLGVETKAYNYLALYNSNSELILNSLQRISIAVSKILKHFNGEIKTEQKEKEIEVVINE